MHSASPTRQIAMTASLVAPTTLFTVFVLGRASDTVVEHGILILVATSVAVLLVAATARRLPVIRNSAIITMVATLAITGAVIGGRSQERVVNERVLTAEPAATSDDMPVEGRMARPAASVEPEAVTTMPPTRTAPAAKPRTELLGSGSFEELGHAGRGTASLIRSSTGRTVLTLTDFEVEPGPDYVVQLVSGNPTTDADVESGTPITLGKLKGTSGDQQYEVPAGTDLKGVTHVYVWCRAFSVGVLRAPVSVS